MSSAERHRRQQILREAEGYLDLLLACGAQWPVATATRDRLVERVLSMLAEIPSSAGKRGAIAYLRGQALRIAERYGEAVSALRDSADIASDNLEVWLALGWCYKRLGRIDLAIEALEEGMAIAPEKAIVHYNLACYWALARNIHLAVEYLTQAFDLDGNYRDLVAAEPDFDQVRNLPEFQQAMTVIV